MTEAMPFLQKAILLSYDPRPLPGEGVLGRLRHRPEEEDFLRRCRRPPLFLSNMHKNQKNAKYHLIKLEELL